MDLSYNNLPSSKDDFPEVPFVTKLRSTPGLVRTGFEVDFPILRDPDVRYATGSRGRTFAKSLRMETYWDSANSKIVGAVYFNMNHEGPPGSVHGGAIATCLDSLLGLLCVRSAGFGYVTLNLNTNYRKFVPLGSVMKLEAFVSKREGKKIFCEGRILDGMTDEVHSEATAIFYRPKGDQSLDYENMVRLIGRDSGITKEIMISQMKKIQKKEGPPTAKL